MPLLVGGRQTTVWMAHHSLGRAIESDIRHAAVRSFDNSQDSREETFGVSRIYVKSSYTVELWAMQVVEWNSRGGGCLSLSLSSKTDLLRRASSDCFLTVRI